MAEVLAFMSAHPVLTFCLAWGIWPICSMAATIAVAPFRYPYLAYSRRLRSLNIRSQGWPLHPLMDADGDIIHPPAKSD